MAQCCREILWDASVECKLLLCLLPWPFLSPRLGFIVHVCSTYSLKTGKGTVGSLGSVYNMILRELLDLHEPAVTRD